ncbi:MAG: methyltransferase family protein [Hyphomicrobiales bacterium]
MITVERAIEALWATWFVVWMLAAVWSGRTVARQPAGSRLLHSALFMVGAALLLFVSTRGTSLGTRLVPRVGWVGWIGAGATFLGLAFTGWARVHLGRLWSGSVTLKEGHRVVRSGPYALTRHPIYTGLLAAAFGTAFAHGTLAALLGALLLTLGLLVKLHGEERLLLEHLGDEYRDYKSKVPALVPRLW